MSDRVSYFKLNDGYVLEEKMTKRTDVETPYYPTYEKSSPGPDPNLKTHLVGSHHIRILNKFNLTNCEQRLTCRGG